jgi:hypothetical protein
MNAQGLSYPLPSLNPPGLYDKMIENIENLTDCEFLELCLKVDPNLKSCLAAKKEKCIIYQGYKEMQTGDYSEASHNV